MRMLLIGLGDIARKAYLPVLSTRADLDIHLATRDAGLGVCHQQHPDVGVGGHHGGDVTPLHHDPAAMGVDHGTELLVEPLAHR